jgi:nicotinamide riboside kinase
MIKRIAIVGTHSTGKSTLIEDLKEKLSPTLSDFYFIKQVNRECHKYGLKINEEANDLTQLYIAANDLKQIVEAPQDKTVISDRCILDTYVYTLSMWKKGKVSEMVLDSISTLLGNCLSKYTHLIWLRPEFEVVPDGVRSVDEEWREELDSDFEGYLKFIKLETCKIITLSGSREERVNKFIDIINE